MTHVEVHPRVNERHPEVADDQARLAWDNAIALVRREGAEDNLYVAVGFDNNGRLLEVVAIKRQDGTWLIFHAMKATIKTLREVGLVLERRHNG